MSQSLESFADARITAHLPSLVYRFTKDRLKATAQLEARMAKEHPAGHPIENVREIRDEIKARVERLLIDLGVTRS